MNITTDVSGWFTVIPVDKDGKELPDDKAQEILNKLQKGELVLGWASKSIYSLDDFQNPVCEVEIELGDMEYKFEEEEAIWA